MSSGLDLNQFLTNTIGGSGGGRGNWLDDWGKRNPPAINVWLHPNAKIFPVWGTTFIEVGEKKQEGSDVKKPTLRFPKWVGIDRPEVYENSRFRENGRLKVPPNVDPFLYLREWLRFLAAPERAVLPLDAVVFEWTDYGRNNVPIQWTVGQLSGLVESNNTTWSHHINPKLSFLFTVIDAANLSAGAKLTSETQLVGEKTQKLMLQQMKAKGMEAGNPLKNPYPIHWEYNAAAKNFGDKYEVFRYEEEGKCEYTDAVYEAFSKEFPDAEPYAKPGQDDLTKIRAAMEQAMQIALPLDLIFAPGDENLKVRRSVLDGAGAPTKGASRSQSTRVDSQAAGSVRPPAAPGAARPTGAIPPPPGTAMRTVVKPPAAAPPAPAAAPAAGGGRRRVAAPPAPPAAPPPPPPVEELPCEKCGTPFPANASQCPHCGQRYEVDPGTPAVPAQAAAPVQSSVEPTAGNRDYCQICGQTAGFKQVNTPEGLVEKCNHCGQERSDDVPFRAEPRLLSSILRIA
jgi:hypothetical protein